MPEVKKLKDTFTVKVKNEETGKQEEVKLAVVRPTAEQERKGQEIFNRALSDAIKSKAPLRAAIEDILVEQGVWNEEKTAKRDALNKAIKEATDKLTGADKSKKLTLEEAKQIALSIRKTRRELRKLDEARDELYTNSAESQADNARFNYFLSVCTRYDPSNESFFKDLDDVYARVNDLPAIIAASRLALLRYNVDSDFQKKQVENKFLIKHGFMNEKLFLLNDQKKPVDDDGRLLDEDGNFINEKGEKVNRDGQRIDENGELIEDTLEFTTEESVNSVEAAEVETQTPARGKKK